MTTRRKKVGIYVSVIALCGNRIFRTVLAVFNNRYKKDRMEFIDGKVISADVNL